MFKNIIKINIIIHVLLQINVIKKILKKINTTGLNNSWNMTFLLIFRKNKINKIIQILRKILKRRENCRIKCLIKIVMIHQYVLGVWVNIIISIH